MTSWEARDTLFALSGVVLKEENVHAVQRLMSISIGLIGSSRLSRLSCQQIHLSESLRGRQVSRSRFLVGYVGFQDPPLAYPR